MKHSIATVGLIGLFINCGEVRMGSEDFEQPPAVTYVDEIGPLFEGKCATCHGEDQTAGGYYLRSWRGLLRPGSDGTPNLAPGDANSRLLTVLSDDERHKPLLDSEQLATVRGWIVDDKMAYFSRDADGYHGRGWMNTADRNATTFHGGRLRAQGWDMRPCQTCHGDDFTGGPSGVSCTSCHQGGPTGCATCHGDGRLAVPSPPSDLAGSFAQSKAGVGMHASHQKVPCASCHVVPGAFTYAKGHLFDTDDRQTDMRAEVVFSDLAKGTLAGLELDASYDRQTHTCTNVYCHPTDGKVTQWVWTESIEGGLGCDSCHGNPPTKTRGGKDHPTVSTCEGCHQRAYKDGKLDPAVHVNGKVEVF